MCRLEEEPGVSLMEDLADPGLRRRLRAAEEGLEVFQVLLGERLLRAIEQQVDVAEVRLDLLRLRDRGPELGEFLPRLVDYGLPPLPRQGLLRPPEELVHLPVALPLDRVLDFREVRVRLAHVEVLGLRDLDVVDQARKLDLHLLRCELALRALEGVVESLLDLPHALVLAFAHRFLRLLEEELGLVRVRSDDLHLLDRVLRGLEKLRHPVREMRPCGLRLDLRPLDEVPRERDVRLEGRLRLLEERVHLLRLLDSECLDHPSGHRDRAVLQGAHVRSEVRGDVDEAGDDPVDPFELVEHARPPLEGHAEPPLDILEDLDHVQGQERRLVSDEHRREERVRGAFDEDRRIPELEPPEGGPRALEGVLDEVLDDGEHPGEDVLVDRLPELPGLVCDQTAVRVDEEHVLDDVRALGLHRELLLVLQLVPVVVERPLVAHADLDGHGAVP